MHSGDLSWRNTLWGSADGRAIPLKEMKIGHLVNVLNWITDLPDRYSQRIIDLMQREADYRKFLGFASMKPYPEKINGRWFVFNPKTGLAKIQKPPKSFLKKVEKNEVYCKLRDRVNQIRNERGIKS